LLNFFLNKTLVFRSHISTGKAMLRYYLLAVPQFLAQIFLTEGIIRLFSIGGHQTVLRAVIYALVNVFLYFASFMIQQRWVFAASKKESK
jgi:putative flippase GtrA